MPHIKPNIEPTITELAYTTEIKLGFPEYIRGGLFQLFRKIPFGWEDRGKVERNENDTFSYSSFKCCIVCNSILRIGKEKDQLFRYCPKCLIKTYIHKK